MPSDLAQRMREARAARALSLDEAERVTKIRRKYLEAIEAGDFAQLPDGPPARGFVKNYARYLGFDPERALSEFEAEVGVPVLQLKEPVPPPPVRTKPVSKLTQVALPDVRWRGELPGEADAELDALAEREGASGGPVVIKTSSQLRATGSSFRLKKLKGPFEEYDPNMLTSRGVRRTRMMPLESLGWSRYLPFALGVIVMAAALGAGVLFFAPRVSEYLSLAAAPRPPATDVPFPPATILAPQPTVQAAAPQDSGGPIIVGTASPATLVQALPSGGMQLALDARERAWVRIKVDGNIVFEGILPIGPSTPFSALQSVEVETGNAGAFDIILNNTRLGPLGTRNETVRKSYSASAP
jgi:hypothetical protein